MGKAGTRINRNVERAVCEIFKSLARSRIYLFLLRKNGATSEQIIKGTKLHPSTIRETLSKMYDQKLIYRKKIKNDSIGKNPYLYYPISPITLLKRYKDEVEDRLNRIASLAFSKEKTNNYRPVKIKIYERGDEE
jgi:predicted transcriptional regulator